MKYQTIVADPPWRYTKRPGLRTGGSGPVLTAEGKYPTMTNPEIAALPVREWASDKAHLYLWITNPHIYGGRWPDGVLPVDIMEAWGFRYVTMLTWHKSPGLGPGWYFRGNTEHVLFGVRGGLGIPASIRKPNIWTARKSRHSAKPSEFFEMVEKVSPGPRLEMFARGPRTGWDVWGNEATR